MSLNRVLISIGFVVVLVGLLYWLLGGKHPPSVEFVSLTNNPVSIPPSASARLILSEGATNLCALFWFTNSNAASVWFKTECAEQKVGGKWIECARPSARWNGVGGGLWFKGSGCLYAVGWPPGLPTNAIWRLQVRYGNDLSLSKLIMNRRLRFMLFRPSQSFDIFPSTEVTP
jgi:hypothetical protein